MKYFWILFISAFSFGQIPSYYSSIDFTATPVNIKTQLSTLITDTHTYISSYADAWNYLKITDLDPANNTNVLLIYGYNDTDSDVTNDRSRNKENNGGNSGQWNREHVYAKSLATPAMVDSGPGADPHLLRASDVQRNNSRGSLPFTYGSGFASYSVNNGWFPGDEWKGDVARIIMYMFLRYGSQCQPNNVAIGSSHTYSPEMPDIFLTWNATDPVSQVEIQRNNYLQSQIGNRNPFIDNPYLATLIWGGTSADNTWNLSVEDIANSEPEISIFPNPVKEILTISEPVSMAEIYSLEGKLLISSPLQNINIADLPANIYIIQLTSLNGKIVKLKFIKN